MRYVLSRYEEYQREMAYRIYIADSLQLSPQGKYISIKYSELINNNRKVDNRSGDEIAMDIIEKCGLKLSDKEC